MGFSFIVIIIVIDSIKSWHHAKFVIIFHSYCCFIDSTEFWFRAKFVMTLRSPE